MFMREREGGEIERWREGGREGGGRERDGICKCCSYSTMLLKIH